jgi:hypothetical protein
LEEIMDAMEISQTHLKKTSKFWHILLIILSNHLNDKTRSKKIDPSNVLTNKEDKTLVAWILGM